MSSTVNLKASGLNTSPNQLETTPGSLTVASNIVIRRNNVIEARRGFKLYGDSFGTSVSRAKQLLTYKGLLLRHYDNILQWDTDGAGDFESFAGTYSELDAGLRIKGIESNGNFYFTTAEGIKKIAAKVVADLTISSGYITNAGGVKALDTQASLDVTQGDSSGFLPADSAVAYRIVWGIKDVNENLILGTPSQRAEVYNPLSNLVASDLNTVLHAIDNAASLPATPLLLSDTDYSATLQVSDNAAGSTLQTNILALAVKLDTDILYANDSGAGAPLNISAVVISGTTCTITVAGTVTDYLAIGSIIKLAGFTVATGTLNGIYTVSNVTATTIVFTTTASGAVTFTSGLVSSGEYEYITSTASPDFSALESLVVFSPATAQQLATIQNALDRIIARLKLENTFVISNTAEATYIIPLATTTSANVTLDFTIPDDVTVNHFYQVYRSATVEATGVTILSDLTPSDELKLAYEAFPTTAELAAQFIQITDITPDQFLGANLYTNASTGEGILQANDVPPAAKDVNNFKNYTFYANTRTRHRYSLSMLPIQQLLSEYAAGRTPVITIANSTNSVSYKFIAGVQEQTEITFETAANTPASSYFTLNSANDDRAYYFWYRKNTASVLSGTDPAIAGKIGVVVDIISTDSDVEVAEKTRDVINTISVDFIAEDSLPGQVLITNVNEGPATTATTPSPLVFNINLVTEGEGEDLATNTVLLSSQVSPALATDATARSFVKVINRSTSAVYAYYLSGAQDVPGKILIESRTLGTTDNPFYILANNSEVGTAFNPTINPDSQVNAGTSILEDIPTVGRVAFNVTAHGLITGDQVLISGTQTTQDESPFAPLDGIYTITRETANQFSVAANIAADVTIVANSVGLIYLPDAEASNNEVKPNRLYYSKFQQPEAVPIVNNISLGAEDKAILRIFPLRDSLFVFKEDGLFRISGESAPFNNSLFDGSCILIAADSLGLLNNALYGWTRKGIETITEAGIRSPTISRPIDTDILPLASSDYTNFSTVTWGTGYESDSSYIVYTLKVADDDVATIAYRYSNLTNSWTTFDKTNTCGIVSPTDDRLYLGAGDTNYIEQERKSFDRTDYADREYSKTLALSSVINDGYGLTFASMTNFEVGDVLVQEQYLTVYEYNMLLNKLDIDPGVNGTDYFDTLEAVSGDDLRTKLEELATKLDADSGVALTDYRDKITSNIGPYNTNILSVSVANPTVITTGAAHSLYSLTSPSEGRWISITGLTTNEEVSGTYEITRTGATTFTVNANVISVTDGAGSFTRLEDDFRDIKACFNIIVNNLNSDTGVFFNNYARNTTTSIQEAVITAVDVNAKIVTLNSALEFVTGPMTLYKHINTEFIYAPQTMGDPLGFKHLREATVMFENKAFTSATVFFGSDLLPEYIDVPFNADGNGIFGHGGFFGSGFFGGTSNSAPFRTYIPLPCQRCRYIVMGFNHGIAREKYSIFGASLTGEVSLSTKAYK